MPSLDPSQHSCAWANGLNAPWPNDFHLQSRRLMHVGKYGRMHPWSNGFHLGCEAGFHGSRTKTGDPDD